jgi:hypothetical protein
MKMLLALALAAGAEVELERLARVATAVVDGDECEKIMTPRALQKMFRADPRDRWAGHDNFDVNDAPFLAVKKLLRRVATLASFPVDCNLWMSFRERPDLVQVLIRQVNEISAFWRFGDLYQPMPPEMKEVLASGKPKTVRQRGVVSVLTPGYNSGGDVVALVEVAARD